MSFSLLTKGCSVCSPQISQKRKTISAIAALNWILGWDQEQAVFVGLQLRQAPLRLRSVCTFDQTDTATPEMELENAITCFSIFSYTPHSLYMDTEHISVLFFSEKYCVCLFYFVRLERLFSHLIYGSFLKKSHKKISISY